VLSGPSQASTIPCCIPVYTSEKFIVIVAAPSSLKNASAAKPGTRIFKFFISSTELMGFVDIIERGAAAQLQQRIRRPDDSAILSHHDVKRSDSLNFSTDSPSGKT